MNINTVKEWFEFVCNKYQKGYISGAEFNNLFNQCQLQYYDFLIGHIEQFQPGRPVTRVGIGVEAVMTKLSPFIKQNNSLTVTTQQATKPTSNTGFGRLLAMYDGANKKLDRVEHDKKGGRISSTVLPVANNPFYVEYATTWEIWPASIATVKIDYLPQKPDDIVWGYTVTSGREVYAATGGTNGNSVHPLWYDTEIAAILARMFKATGVVLDDAQIMNYGQSVINMGD